MNNITERYATAAEAGKILNRSVVSLERWRRLRIGPPYYRVAGRILYDRNEVVAWVEAQRQAPGEAA
jgi:hypothetical protein